jgi:hypothetical protein
LYKYKQQHDQCDVVRYIEHISIQIRVNTETQSCDWVTKNEAKRIEQQPNGVPCSKIHYKHFTIHSTKFTHEEYGRDEELDDRPRYICSQSQRNVAKEKDQKQSEEKIVCDVF